MRLILNDGTALDGASLIRSGLSLFLYIPGLTLAEVFALLIDPEKTERIEAIDGTTDRVFEHYTKLIAVRDEGNMITAMLTREDEENV